MTRGRILYCSRFTPAICRAHPDKRFVFGDNLARRGKGGQACIRDEPNAIGVPTKRTPYTTPGAYFIDADLDDARIRSEINIAFGEIDEALLNGRDVVISTARLGTGLAQLRRRAPRIHAYIEARIRGLED